MAEPETGAPTYDKLAPDLKKIVDGFIDIFRKAVASVNPLAKTDDVWLANMREGAATEIKENRKNYAKVFEDVLNKINPEFAKEFKEMLQKKDFTVKLNKSTGRSL